MSKIRLILQFGLVSGPPWLCHITVNGNMAGTCVRDHMEESVARLALL
jgi:hypothetical protein